MDVIAYNRNAWNKEAQRAGPYSQGASPEAIAAAREGRLTLHVTPTTPVPAPWLPPLAGCRALCLAGGGGKQGPLLAAAGAAVTVFDLSPAQLAEDQAVAAREGLTLQTVEGDMRDLACFAAASFDLVVQPVATCFVPDVRPVWREVARVLAPGGTLLAGFLNPIAYTLDKDLERTRQSLTVKHALPYSDLASLSDEERARYMIYDAPLEYSHSLTDLIGGQLDAGLTLDGFMEDGWGGAELVDRYFPVFLATRATMSDF